VDGIELLTRKLLDVLSPRKKRIERIPEIPDTVEELLASIDDEGALAIFWAMTPDGDCVAEARFRVRGGQGVAIASVERKGCAIGYKVHIPSTNSTVRGPWDDRIPIHVRPGDTIKFHFTLKSEQT
jgi:hypothetical protein